MSVHDIAAAARRFRDDETYQALIEEITNDQVLVFRNPDSSQEDRDEAHEIIRALGKLAGAIDAKLADSAMARKKDQHRADD